MIANDLKIFKAEFDDLLVGFLKGKRQKLQEQNFPEEFLRGIDVIESFALSGGKRLRPWLFCKAYVVNGGSLSEKEVLRLSLSLEILHIYFLIHDDILDHDEVRHNAPTAHVGCRRWVGEVAGGPVGEEVGVGLAMLLGDLVYAWVGEPIMSSELAFDLKLALLSKISQTVETTIAGETLDVFSAWRKDFAESDALLLAELKTAHYTLAAPLEMGLMAAGGGDREERDFLCQLSLPLGIAYQLQDDILGIFGTADVIGKPVGSDLREGKRNFLLLNALKNAAPQEKAILLQALEKGENHPAYLNRVQEVVKKSGALSLTERKIANRFEQFEQVMKANEQLSAKYAFIADLVKLVRYRNA